MKPKEAIKLLEQCDPEEELLITWWGDSDWKPYKDTYQAYDLAEQQLEVCIGHVNDWMESQYQEEKKEEIDA
jgi:inhibitor of KinA sporulation pathway (predicted exonuclease)